MTSATLSGLLAAHVLATTAAQEPPRFESRVERVFVDAYVSRDGAPLVGLRADDFEVRDNGVVQQVRLEDVEGVPLGVVLALDSSASVAGELLGELRSAGGRLLSALRPGELAALISFGQGVQLVVPPTSDLRRVRQGLARIDATGSTALYDAAFAAISLPMEVRRRVVVVFTDGADTSSWLRADDVRSASSRSDALVHVVGRPRRAETGVASRGGNAARRLLESATTGALRKLAESSGGRFWPVTSPAQLEQTLAGILEELRSRYLLSYEPVGVERDGWHRIDVRLSTTRARVRARRGYHRPRSRP